MKRALELPAVMGLAFLSALNYCIFVFPNRFAPAGVDGICTMIQDVFSVNMGYLALLINIPLLAAAFCILNREFAVKSALFILAFSLSVILLEKADLSRFLYATDTGTSIVLAPIAAGTVRGILYAATLKCNGSAGGIDIISALIKHKKPYLDFMNIIFAINMLIAVSSYFVYGMTLEPVICSILYAFVTSTVCNKLRAAENALVKFEIITREPEALCAAIGRELHQNATVMQSKDAPDGTGVILCAVKKEMAPYVEELILRDSHCTVCKSTVSGSVAGIGYK